MVFKSCRRIVARPFDSVGVTPFDPQSRIYCFAFYRLKCRQVHVDNTAAMFPAAGAVTFAFAAAAIITVVHYSFSKLLRISELVYHFLFVFGARILKVFFIVAHCGVSVGFIHGRKRFFKLIQKFILSHCRYLLPLP